MKKFFAIAMIAASLTACGGGETKTEETPVDSAAAAVVDSAAAVVDTAAKVVDSAAAVVDSAAKKVEEVKKP